MEVQQISVFLENQAGRFSAVTAVLQDANVNVRGFSVSDTVDFAIARIVVDNPEAAISALERHGYLARTTPIIVLELKDTPGELSRILSVVAQAGISINYAYSLVSTYVAIQVVDPQKAHELLAGQPVHWIDQEGLAQMCLSETPAVPEAMRDGMRPTSEEA